jgi:Fe2+ or Zn2+ uptake regulation protein
VRGFAEWYERENLTRAEIEAICEKRHIVLGDKAQGILDAIYEDEPAFDFEILWRRARSRMPRIARGTIYNALRRFRRVGILRAAGAQPRSPRLMIP